MSRGHDGRQRVVAVFEGPGRLVELHQRLVDRLGLAPSAVEVRSSAPLPHDVAAALGGGHGVGRGLPWIALAGALTGGLIVFVWAAESARSYPLVTGGMPVVAGPPLGVVTYEGVALGLILSTVVAVLVRAGLLKRTPAPRPFDAHLAAGRILVEVAVEPGSAAAVRAQLEAVGAVDVLEEPVERSAEAEPPDDP